jgi:hypothetical protein
VFRYAMDDDQYGLRFVLGLPGLVIQLKTGIALKGALAALHLGLSSEEF